MEKKRIQRIIGILVVVALVIVVMPLLFGKNDMMMTQEAKNIKAPSFSEQDAQTVVAATTSAASAVMTNDPIGNAPNQDVAMRAENDTVAAESASATTTSSMTMDQQATAANNLNSTETVTQKLPVPDALTQQAKAAVNNSVSAAEKEKANTVEITPEMAKALSGGESASNKKAATDSHRPTNGIVYEPVQPATTMASNSSASTMMEQSPVATTPASAAKPAPAMKSMPAATLGHKKSTHRAIAHMHTMTMMKTQSTAWAVQMGNFKVKQNAMHMTAKLRAAGYKTFTREIKTANGSVMTRVYIGPEFKQASAARLSDQVQHHLNMHGLVVPYHVA